MFGKSHASSIAFVISMVLIQISKEKKKGKTEVVVLFHGEGSKGVRRHIKIDLDSTIPVRVRSSGQKLTSDIRCVDF